MTSLPITNTQQVAQEGIDLLHHSGFCLFSNVTLRQDLVGDTAVVRPLYIGQMLVSYLIGERVRGIVYTIEPDGDVYLKPDDPAYQDWLLRITRGRQEGINYQVGHKEMVLF
jgi:hypothetical protein